MISLVALGASVPVTAPPAGAGSLTSGALLAPLDACPHQSSLTTPADDRQAMDCLVNWARKTDGLIPLTLDAQLATAARLKLADDVRCDAFTHTPCSVPFTRVFTQAGYLTTKTTSYQVGENIAWGGAAVSSPREIMLAWLRSPPHRANILDPSYRQMGVSYLAPARFLNTTGARLWANDFGARG